MKVSIIGCGNMGGAIVRGLKDSSIIQHIYLFDPRAEAIQSLQSFFEGSPVKVESLKGIPEALKGDILILGVKPSLVKEIALSLSGSPKGVISLAAGVSLGSLMKWFQSSNILRSMPNLGALGGSSLTAVAPAPGASVDFIRGAMEILKTVGEVIQIPEEYFGVFTGLSGSGIAFLLEAMEGLIQGGQEGGLSPELSRSIILDTMKSAMVLTQVMGESPGDIIPRITSPGGTTIRGIEILREAQIARSMKDAVLAATERALEIELELKE